MCCLDPCCDFDIWRLLGVEPQALNTISRPTPLDQRWPALNDVQERCMCCCMTLTGDAAVPIPARRVQDQGFSPPRLHCGTCDDCQCCSKWDGSPAGRKRGKQLIELFPSSAAKIHPLHPTRTVSQASVNHNHIRSSGTSVRKFPFPLLFLAVA